MSRGPAASQDGDVVIEIKRGNFGWSLEEPKSDSSEDSASGGSTGPTGDPTGNPPEGSTGNSSTGDKASVGREVEMVSVTTGAAKSQNQDISAKYAPLPGADVDASDEKAAATSAVEQKELEEKESEAKALVRATKTLLDIDIRVTKGQLVAIVGSVGSG